jgi:hypothetical protein
MTDTSADDGLDEAKKSAQAELDKARAALRKISAPLTEHGDSNAKKAFAQLLKSLQTSTAELDSAEDEATCARLEGVGHTLQKATEKLAATLPKAEAEEEEDDEAGVTIKVVSSAKKEVLIRSEKMAQALRMVATGQAGRGAPKIDGVPECQHIHVGGNAKENLLFKKTGPVVLGVIDFHIESSNNKQQKEQVQKVAKRSGATITLRIDGKDISEVEE